ncbi:fimbrillin family protein [Bacteroides sp.]|uniref:fimbrillin family protein n=1 Tax=Bacteroides sp. TaxID=29523 RepID=UPI003AB1E8E4
MKKIFLMALAASAMMSCSESEMLDNGGQQAEIKVGTMVKAGTKAAVTDNDNFTAFTVSAYTVAKADIATTGLGEAYMNAVDYIGKQGAWSTTGGTYYWPVNQAMQFFAYPTTAKADFTKPDTGYPTLKFGVESLAKDQTDLVVAYSEDVTKPIDNKLTLNFKHILTRINFSYKPADAAYDYTISEVKIKGVSGGVATYKFADNSWDLTGAGTTLATDYIYPTAVGTQAGDFYPLDDATGGSLMLFPQEVGGKTISVKYAVKKGGISFFDGEKTVTLPGDAAWGVGQNIRYKLTLPVGAEEITLETSVDAYPSENETPGTAA